jgi:hypothetical protein
MMTVVVTTVVVGMRVVILAQAMDVTRAPNWTQSSTTNMVVVVADGPLYRGGCDFAAALHHGVSFQKFSLNVVKRYFSV